MNLLRKVAIEENWMVGVIGMSFSSGYNVNMERGFGMLRKLIRRLSVFCLGLA